ncbi:hypothetical protein T484DRAFT_1908089 [Baffinella frigidus]|nr:hypothetical protein T484DRAFT_1908089 [Cryptophyta sp. CCMP2293]
MVADSLVAGAEPLLVAVHGETDTWEELEPLVRRHCQPFGGFAWTPKRADLDAVVVERLELRFHAAGDAVLDEGAPPLQWSSRSFLHILVLRCDDAKAYKDSVFERTSAWVAARTDARQELLLVHVQRQAPRQATLPPKLLPAEGIETLQMLARQLRQSYHARTLEEATSFGFKAASSAAATHRKMVEKLRADLKLESRIASFDFSQSPPASLGDEAHKADAQLLGALICQGVMAAVDSRRGEYQAAASADAITGGRADLGSVFLARDALAALFLSLGAPREVLPAPHEAIHANRIK